MSTKQQWLIRVLTGGLLGMAALLLIGCLAGSFSIYGDNSFRGLMLVDGAMVLRLGGWEGLAVTVQFALFFLLGAVVGVSTLPFADEGRALALRSLAHFAVTAALVALLAGLNFGLNALPVCLALLALVYLLIWLGRWVGWYAEVAAIREKLGLAPGPSLFKWRETLPYFFFALLLCDVLPFVLRALDARDVPVLTGLLLPYLLLPVGGFFSGLSLGKRQGFCPLYPPFCALCYLPVVFLLFNSSALFHCGVVFCAALAGGLAGAAARHKKTPPAPEER